MNPEELFRGESETIEYKASVAPKSEAYMKTVIAFANGRGGQLLFGVQDISGEALGLGRKTVFKYMDAVANAIASKCEPRIHPHIYLYEIDRKPIIIVDVPPGAETPYWIQSEGIENGTYVRVGATTRKADRYRIEELILRGQHKFFDQELTDVIVKEKDAQKFCDDLFEYVQSRDPDGIDEDRRVGIGQLLSWGLLHEADNHFYASNGYLLMGGPNAKFADTGIQCAVYRGNRRGHTLVRRVYDGTFYENIDGAMQFIRAHLVDRDSSDELFPRSRIAELPPESIREILVNAVCHRSYQTPGKIQVAIFDDKIEIISPGGLDCSLAVEDVLRGRSRMRNPAIASALRYAGLFEGWGNGIPQLLADAEEHNLPDPVVRARPGDFLVRIAAAEADEPDEATEETEMLIPAGSIVQIPTVALMEPSSSSVGMEQQHDSYEYVPFDAFAAAEPVTVPQSPPPAQPAWNGTAPSAQEDEWHKDVELAEHVNSVLSGAIDRTRSKEPAPQPKQKRRNADEQKPQEAVEKAEAHGRQDASGNGSKQQSRKDAQQRQKQQKGRAKQQENGKQQQTADTSQRQNQNREKTQQKNGGSNSPAETDNTRKQHAGGNAKQKDAASKAATDADKVRPQPTEGKPRQQDVDSNAPGDADKARPESAEGKPRQQDAGSNASTDAEKAPPQPAEGKTRQQNDSNAPGDLAKARAPHAEEQQQQSGEDTQNGDGNGSSRRNRRARRARKRAQERAAELEAALDAAEPEEKAKVIELRPGQKPVQKTSKNQADSGLTDSQARVLELLRENPAMTQNALRDATSLTLSVVRRILVELEEMKRLKREGGRRYGKWVVLD